MSETQCTCWEKQHSVITLPCPVHDAPTETVEQETAHFECDNCGVSWSQTPSHVVAFCPGCSVRTLPEAVERTLAKDLLERTKPFDAEGAKIINDNLWDLYETVEQEKPPPGVSASDAQHHPERIWHWCAKERWKPFPQLACSYCGTQGPNIHAITMGEEGEPQWQPNRETVAKAATHSEALKKLRYVDSPLWDIDNGMDCRYCGAGFYALGSEHDEGCPTGVILTMYPRTKWDEVRDDATQDPNAGGSE